MCWNFEISFLTGLISYIIAFYIWARNYQNDRWHSIILFTFSSIQWMDAIIWYNVNNKSSIENFTKIVVTLFIPLILALEPLSSMYGAKYVGKPVSNVDLITYIIIFIMLFAVLVSNNSYPNYIHRDEVFKRPTIKYSKNESGNNIMYWIFFLLIIYPINKYATMNVFYLTLIGTIGLCLVVTQLTAKAISSNWCLYSNIIGLLMLLYPFMNISLK